VRPHQPAVWAAVLLLACFIRPLAEIVRILKKLFERAGHSSPRRPISFRLGGPFISCSVGVGSLDVLRSGSAPVPIDAPVDVPPDDLRRDLAGAPSVAPAARLAFDYLCSAAASVDRGGGCCLCGGRSG